MNRRLLQLGLSAAIALIFVPAPSAAHHHHGHNVSPPVGGCAADAVAPTIVKGHHHKPVEVVGHRGKGGKGTQPPTTTPCPPTGVGTSGDGSLGDGSSSPGNGGAIIGIDDGPLGGNGLDGGNGLGGDGPLGGLGGGDGVPGGDLGNGVVVTDNFYLSDVDGSLGSNGDYLAPSSPTVAAAPEPATLALLGIGLVGLGFSRRRKVK